MPLLPGRFLRYGVRGGIAASVLGLVLSRVPDETQLTAQNSKSADPSAESVPAWQLETRIYKALRADETLARQRIGVTLKDRKAELWGFVPDAASERRAVSIAEGIAGVSEVVSHLRRVTPEDPLLAAVSEAVKTQKEGVAFAGGGPAPASPILPNPGFGPDRAQVALSIPPVQRLPVSVQPIRERESVTLKPQPSEAVTEFSPQSAIDAIYAGDAGKFGDLQVVMKDRVVYISGRVEKKSHANELAGLIADVPGVKRVVMQKIEFR